MRDFKSHHSSKGISQKVVWSLWLNPLNLGQIECRLIFQAKERRLAGQQRLRLHAIDWMVCPNQLGKLVEADNIPSRAVNDEQRSFRSLRLNGNNRGTAVGGKRLRTSSEIRSTVCPEKSAASPKSSE